MNIDEPIYTFEPETPAPEKKPGVKAITWAYRLALLLLLFGVSSLTYGSDQTSPVLSAVSNIAGLVAATMLFVGYFDYPSPYKLVAWVLSLALFGLVLESLHTYNLYFYSFFVIKRLAYCGLALLTFVVARRAGTLKLGWAVMIVGALYFYGQILLGKILEYSLTSESRSTSAYESFYLMLPLLFFLMQYLEKNRLIDFLGFLGTFGLIVLLLHRSVISSAVFGVAVVAGLSMMGKLPGNSRLPIGRTASTLFILALLIVPFVAALSPKKVDAFLENIGGIAKPTEDNTGNWRLEQSIYYWSQIPDRPWLGWRYEGYDRGEIMVNEDFPEKGTIIHSQYIDMLYNYGIAGLGLNLFVIFCTLWMIYSRNRKFTFEQTVLFAFITSGLLFGISYQLPIYYWGYVGLGLYYGFKPAEQPVADLNTINIDHQTDMYPMHVQDQWPNSTNHL
ncbi:O-antigen ligase family protein [Fibrella forsythiae]|uniref:O-antigen ligase family protein n=1 Tax=Fibrella forsythiae TaxID=2817061 RepID=A0ABS3JKH4_9BACT|nr:O-antigen ligase family protein [Fibrella forsythiae]MBO0949724.1 O-antigen ligase family protein [Fibrella forsythiae]